MFAGKKSAQIREILISESAWEEMTCLFAPSLVVSYAEIIPGESRHTAVSHTRHRIRAEPFIHAHRRPHHQLPEFDPSVYNDAIRGQHLLAMKALRQKFGINENMTHVEKGLPEEVIPDLAEHLQAGIVVLGTVGRTGISAAFLGNTAEQVIDHLRCDLLVIKPDQYQTPVELDDEEDD